MECIQSIIIGSPEKKNPLPLILTTCTTFPTSIRNSRFESRFRTKNDIYKIYTMYIQPKKQFKAQIIRILEEMHSFY